MATRVAINGFGRIGRGLLRVLQEHPSLELAHVNDPMPLERAAYLLAYDSVMGRFPLPVAARDGALAVGDRPIPMTHAAEPGTVGWGELGVDVVVNSSGVRNDRTSLEQHLARGARRVVVSAPAPDAAHVHVLRGVNDADLLPHHRIVSGGSCTAHCFAPVIVLLAERFQLRRGFLQTVHAYTSGQSLTDGPHPRDPRRGRAAAANIVPTTTEAIGAFEAALPAFRGLLHGMAMRVPVVDGSNIDLILELDPPPDGRGQLNALLRHGAEGRFSGVLDYTEDPIVSSDVVGSPASCTVDGLLTDVHGPLVRLFLWYDNELGYIHRLAELLDLVGALPG